jgi:hypothetical protein
MTVGAGENKSGEQVSPLAARRFPLARYGC